MLVGFNPAQQNYARTNFGKQQVGFGVQNARRLTPEEYKEIHDKDMKEINASKSQFQRDRDEEARKNGGDYYAEEKGWRSAGW